MKLTFLGTGGGRHVVISQLRATGGFIVEGGTLKLLVDPGPGALVRAREFKKDLKKMNVIFVSHAHPDHYTDLEMAIEAMTLGAHQKRGVLIGSESVIFGTEDERTIVSKYHLGIVEKYFSLVPGDEIEIPGAKIRATKCQHSEKKAVGFLLTDETGEKLGYTSDGEYYDGQPSSFLLHASVDYRGDIFDNSDLELAFRKCLDCLLRAFSYLHILVASRRSH